MFERVGLTVLLCILMTAQADTVSALRDPTRPSGWRAAEEGQEIDHGQPTAFRLQAIFSHAGKRTAMISGRRVIEGDRIGDARVVRIEASRVTLEIAGESIELAAADTRVKSPTGENEVLP